MRPRPNNVPGSVAHGVVVCRFFLFIALFVGLSLGLVRFTLLWVQGLPFLAQNLADLACDAHGVGQLLERPTDVRKHVPKLIPSFSARTVSRLSFAKNMYADKPRLGALGSMRLVSQANGRVRWHQLTLLSFPASFGLGLGLACGLLLGHCDCSCNGGQLVNPGRKNSILIVVPSIEPRKCYKEHDCRRCGR